MKTWFGGLGHFFLGCRHLEEEETERFSRLVFSCCRVSVVVDWIFLSEKTLLLEVTRVLLGFFEFY